MNGLIGALVLATVVPVAAAVVAGEHDAKSHECTQCPCFVVYPECDMWTEQPYAVADDPMTVSEDECVYACRKDSKCQAAVWGVVGGRDWFTCELYKSTTNDQIQPADDLGYVQPLNVYVKRIAMPCMLPDPKDLKAPKTSSNKAALQRIADRKALYGTGNYGKVVGAGGRRRR